MQRKGVITPINVIAGLIIIAGGVVTIFGKVNLGALLAGVGLIIAAIKTLIKYGI